MIRLNFLDGIQPVFAFLKVALKVSTFLLSKILEDVKRKRRGILIESLGILPCKMGLEPLYFRGTYETKMIRESEMKHDVRERRK